MQLEGVKLGKPIRTLPPRLCLEVIRTGQVDCISRGVNTEKQAVFISSKVKSWKSMMGSETTPVASPEFYTDRGKFGLCGHLGGSIAADKTFPRFTAGGRGACHLNEPVGGAAYRILHS